MNFYYELLDVTELFTLKQVCDIEHPGIEVHGRDDQSMEKKGNVDLHEKG